MTAVIGVPQLLARLSRAAAIGEAAALHARDALGSDIAERARADVPVDTGATRDSIVYADGVVSVGTDYAPFIEYGTSDTPARPFLRPAADTTSDEHALSVAAADLRAA